MSAATKAANARASQERDLRRRRASLIKRVGWFPGRTTGRLHRDVTGHSVGQESTERLLRQLEEEGHVKQSGGTWWPGAAAPADSPKSADEPADESLEDRVRRSVEGHLGGASVSMVQKDLDLTTYQVRRAIKRLLDEGRVVEIGTTSGAGRPARLYGVTFDLVGTEEGPDDVVGETTEPVDRAIAELQAARSSLVDLVPEHRGWLEPILQVVEATLRSGGPA